MKNSNGNLVKSGNSSLPLRTFIEYENGIQADSITDWDYQVLFDTYSRNLRLKPGELQIDRLANVEDTKGNNGQPGVLTITNMRLIWSLAKNNSSNLSIGLSCIQSTNITQSASKLMSNSRSLHVLVKLKSLQYHFIFTHLIPDNPRMFVTVQSVIKAYQSSRLYRELKIRGTFMTSNKELILLPDEILEDQITGIWNVSGEHGHLGAFYLTNVRLVWYSMMNNVYNVSIPFRQILVIRAQQSKYGNVLIFETSETTGKFTLGFRVDPESRLTQVCSKVKEQWKIVNLKPIIGVSVIVEESSTNGNDDITEKMNVGEATNNDNVKIIDEQMDLLHIEGEHQEEENEPDGTAYLQKQFLSTVGDAEVEIVFDTSIGLAVEKLPNNMTLQQLWNAL